MSIGEKTGILISGRFKAIPHNYVQAGVAALFEKLEFAECLRHNSAFNYSVLYEIFINGGYNKVHIGTCRKEKVWKSGS